MWGVIGLSKLSGQRRYGNVQHRTRVQKVMIMSRITDFKAKNIFVIFSGGVWFGVIGQAVVSFCH